jgi:hypothetical protein
MKSGGRGLRRAVAFGIVLCLAAATQLALASPGHTSRFTPNATPSGSPLETLQHNMSDPTVTTGTVQLLHGFHYVIQASGTYDSGSFNFQWDSIFCYMYDTGSGNACNPPSRNDGGFLVRVGTDPPDALDHYQDPLHPHSTANELPYSSNHVYTADFYPPVDGVLKLTTYCIQNSTDCSFWNGTITVSIYSSGGSPPPSSTPTPTPTASRTTTPTPTPTSTATSTPTPTPTSSETPTPTPTPTGSSDLSPPTVFCSTARAESEAPCVSIGDNVTPEMKAKAKLAREDAVRLYLWYCAVEVDSNDCSLVRVVMVAVFIIAHDPADLHFMKVVLSVSSTAGSGGIHCSKGLSAAACSRLRAAAARYGKALATAKSVGLANAITLDRFAGAVKAHSPQGAFLQGAVGKVYAGKLAVALQGLSAAGRALAAQIRADHLDGRVKAKVAARELASSIPVSALRELVAEGLAGSTKQARVLLTNQLKGLSGSVDLADVLAARLPTAPFTVHFRTITLRGLSAIVTALARQGTISGSTGNTLNADLGQAKQVCSTPSALKAAIAKFMSDAAARAGKRAADMLTFGARPLSGGNVGAAACA